MNCMTETFACMSELKASQLSTGKNGSFLAFRIDWVCKGVLADTIELVEYRT